MELGTARAVAINPGRPAVVIWRHKKYFMFAKFTFDFNESMRFYCIQILEKSISYRRQFRISDFLSILYVLFM